MTKQVQLVDNERILDFLRGRCLDRKRTLKFEDMLGIDKYTFKVKRFNFEGISKNFGK